MLTAIQIKNFRGFRDLKIEPLKRVNLIVGQNNTGKTGLLEALALLLTDPPESAGNLPYLFRSVSGDQRENYWRWLLFNKDTNNSAKVMAKFEGLPEFGVWLGTTSPDGACRQAGSLGNMPLYTLGQRLTALLKPAIFSTHPSNPTQDAIDYNRVILKRRKKQVEDMLRSIEPRLQTIEALQTSQQSPLIYADLGLSEMIPVTQLGQVGS